MKSTINHAFSIKILILVFFLVGLENITLPPIDAHDWRQTLTLSIAHNFLDHSNIFYPRMDIGGQGDGIMACEFPIFNYLLAGIFKIFGPHDWYGRLLNWTISCAGLWFFYELVRKSSNARVAFFASIVLMGSVVFEYARKSMPDTFALFTTMAGVWFLWRYIERASIKYLILGFILTVCGILSKIPFLVLLSFLIVPFLDNRYTVLAKRNVIIAVSIVMGCVGWWYFYWMPHLLETYGNQLIWPVSLQDGWTIVTDQLAPDSWRMLMDITFGYKTTFLIAIMGLGVLLTGSNTRLKWLVAIYGPLFLLFALKTGIVFPTHEYYVIPLVPLLALFFGYFFDQLKWPDWALILLAMLVLFQGFIHFKERSFTPIENRGYLMSLTNIMNQYTQPEDKIMVNNGQFNPTMMYWAKRRGWTVNQDVPARTEWMPDFKKQGLKYILIDRHLSEAPLPYTLVYEDEHFRLYGI